MLMTEWKKARWLGIERRRFPRDPVSWPTAINRGGGAAIDIRVLDISPMGFSAGCSRELTEEERIRVALPILGQVDAEVVWCIAGHFGACFKQPIAEAAYTRLLDAMCGGR